jgi:hypothetical protein
MDMYIYERDRRDEVITVFRFGVKETVLFIMLIGTALNPSLNRAPVQTRTKDPPAPSFGQNEKRKNNKTTHQTTQRLLLIKNAANGARQNSVVAVVDDDNSSETVHPQIRWSSAIIFVLSTTRGGRFAEFIAGKFFCSFDSEAAALAGRPAACCNGKNGLVVVIIVISKHTHTHTDILFLILSININYRFFLDHGKWQYCGLEISTG